MLLGEETVPTRTVSFFSDSSESPSSLKLSSSSSSPLKDPSSPAIDPSSVSFPWLLAKEPGLQGVDVIRVPRASTADTEKSKSIALPNSGPLVSKPKPEWNDGNSSRTGAFKDPFASKLGGDIESDRDIAIEPSDE